MPDENKQPLAELVITGGWDQLPWAFHATPDAAGRGDRFCEFRAMAIMVFSRSKKVTELPLDRKRGLGAAILSTRTREELVALMM